MTLLAYQNCNRWICHKGLVLLMPVKIQLEILSESRDKSSISLGDFLATICKEVVVAILAKPPLFMHVTGDGTSIFVLFIFVCLLCHIWNNTVNFDHVCHITFYHRIARGPINLEGDKREAEAGAIFRGVGFVFRETGHTDLFLTSHFAMMHHRQRQDIFAMQHDLQGVFSFFS
ncbi:hypothetical protein ACJX0J_024780, partial [Zea mays]